MQFFCRDLFLVVTDLYSRFPAVEVMKKKIHYSVINQYGTILLKFGYLESIKHNNGPPFNNSEFRDYLKSFNTQDSQLYQSIHNQIQLSRI